jgi:hypothetical protein
MLESLSHGSWFSGSNSEDKVLVVVPTTNVPLSAFDPVSSMTHRTQNIISTTINEPRFQRPAFYKLQSLPRDMSS